MAHLTSFFSISRRMLAIFCIAALLFIFVVEVTSAAPLSFSEQNSVASLWTKLSTLKTLLDSLKTHLFRGSMAQVSSSCSSSLIALLGDGCHYMYVNSSGQSVYCDGPMTKSAKEGDTATTTGCSSSTTTTTTTTTTSSCSSSLVSLLGSGCHYMYTNSSGQSVYCDGPMTKSAKEGDTTAGTGCSSSSGSTTGTASCYNYNSQSTCEAASASGCAWYANHYDGSHCDNTAHGTSSGGATSTCAPETCYNATYCSDGIDNDSDGFTDSADPGCGGSGSTTGTFSLNAATNLSATFRSASSDVELKWTDNSVEENIKISRRTSGGNWSQIGTRTAVGGGTGTYYDTAISAGTTYEYHINSCGGGNCSPDSNTASVVVPATAAIGPKPPVVSNIVVSGITTNSVTISWTTDKEANSKIEYWITTVTGDFKSDPAFFTNHSLTLTGLQASTTYTYNVVSQDQNYYTGTASNQRFTTAPSGYSTPSTTCDSALISLLGDGCHFMFNDNSGNAVYCDGPMTKSAKRGDTSTTVGCSGSGTGSGTSSCDSALITLLGTGCHYMYNDVSGNQVFCDGPMTKSAKRGDTTTTTGCSSYSPPTTYSLNKVTDLRALFRTSGDVELVWTDNSIEDEYRIWRKVAGGSYSFLGTKTRPYNDGGTINYYDTNVSSNTAYEYMIKACISSGNCATEDSNAATVTTGTVSQTGYQCSDGRDNDNDGFIDYPADTSCYDRTDNDEFYPQSGGQTASCTTISSQNTCQATSGCQWNVPSSSVGSPYCSMIYAGDGGSCPGFAYSRWDTNGKRYCELNNTRACQYTYPDYLDIGKYTSGACPATGGGTGISTTTTPTTALCPANYHYHTLNSVVHCMLATDEKVCQSPTGGTTYACPVEIYHSTATTTLAVRVDGLAPSSGPLGTVVTVHGTGFTPTKNRLNFEGGVIFDLISPPDGKTVNFTVPDDRVPLCAVTEPRCLLPAPYAPVKPGSYNVSVTNTNGTSNAIPFSVTEKYTYCPAGYHYMAPFATITSGYCMSDTNSSVCVPAGGGATYACPGSTTSTTTVVVGDITPPYVDYERSSPRSGDTDVPTNTKIHMVFNEEVDPSSFGISQFFSLSTVDYATLSQAYASYIIPPQLPGRFEIFSNGFDFIPTSALNPGKSYTWRVFPGIKDRSGNKTTTDNYGTFTTSGSVTFGGGSLAGTVTDGKGGVVSGAYLSLSNFSYSFYRNAETTAAGAYKFSDIPAGSYRISLSPPYNKTSLISPTDITVTIEKGVEMKKDLSFLASTKTIKGVLKTKAGVAIGDANVGAYRKDGPGGTQTTTDAKGAFELMVGGGTWNIGAWPKDYARANWIYEEDSVSVVFRDDTTLETKIVELLALTQNAKITGKLLKADGTVPANFEASVAVNAPGRGYPVSQLGSDGSFSVAVTAGDYEVFVWSSDPAVKIAPLKITVAEGETKDLGTIKLAKAIERITGKVIDANGSPISGVVVSAYGFRGGGYASAKSGTNGEYILSVTPGIWTVSIQSEPGNPYVPYDSPEEVEVKSGGTTTRNIRVAILDATISGVVKDSTGSVVNDFYGYVFLEGGNRYSGGSAVDRGTFTLRVQAGTHRVALDVPPGSQWTSAGPVSVTVAKGETARTSIVVKKSTSGISGVIRDTGGNAIVGIPFRVFAAGENGTWQEASVDTLTGSFTLRVAAGTWFLGASSYGSRDGKNFFQQGKDIKVSVPDGTTVKQDIILVSSDAIIKGVVTKPDGSPMPNIWVSVDSRSHSTLADVILSSAAFYGYEFSTGAQTDSFGRFEVSAPAGIYYVHVYASYEKGFINPEEQKITVEKGETKDLKIGFRSPNTVIKGITYLETTPAESFVAAWSEKGGYIETKSAADGAYSLKVSGKDVWHVYASREYQGEWYRSAEATVALQEEGEAKQDLILIGVRKLPPPVQTVISADKPSIINVEDGTKVTVPANSVATAGTATVTISPDTEFAAHGNRQVVGVGYEVNAYDAKGKTVNDLNTAITITIPYDPKELEAQGLKPEDLKIAYFDEATQTWKELKASVVNESDHTVSATVDHLTRFAIVAAADIVPPAAPTEVVASALGEGKIKLSWKNPAKDFSHAKLYRSEKQGEVGSIKVAEIFGNTFTDDGVGDGRSYFYIVRAIDPAGNESGNKDQVSVVAKGTSVAFKNIVLSVGKKVAVVPPPEKATPIAPTPTPTAISGKALTRNFGQGAKGDDMKTLQALLAKEGVYPEAVVNGFFGKLTKQAVIRFQEKYADEILKPVGLAKGNGFVGTGTRKKINMLLSQ